MRQDVGAGIGSIQGTEKQSLKCCQIPFKVGQAPLAQTMACTPNTFAAGLHKITCKYIIRQRVEKPWLTWQ